MKALLFDNKVIEVREEAFPTHKDFKWMDAPEGCESGWILQKGKLIAPEKPPTDPLREWQAKMLDTDTKLPRYIEDIIDALDSTTKARIPDATIALYEEKKTIREQRPK